MEMTDAAPSGRGAARDQLAAADHLQAVVAFHKWRHACLRSTYRKAVAEALEDVAEDEAAFKELKKSHAELRERHAELIGQHNALSAEHVRSQEAVSELSATATRLYGGTEECEAATKQARDELDAFKTLHEADVRRRDEDLRKHRSATQGLEEQVRSMAQEQGRLLRLLSDRDALVAQYGAEAAGEGARVRTLAAEVERLGNKAELNGAHVATAEQMLTQRADTISTLHAELARLRDKYLSELSELKAARAAAGEASRLKEQLSESQGVASAVAACRDDLRRALDAATAQMVASDERARRLQAAASVREEVVRALDNASHPLAEDATVIEHLAGELDAKVAEAANLSSKLASTQAVVTQQQAHFARLAAESAEQAKALSDVGAERAMQWRVIGELHAEMSRLAAQAAAGPMLLLSPEGRLTPAAQPSAASAAGAAAAGAGAPHTRPRVSASQQLSAVETQATAMSVLIADKAFGIRALDAKLRAIGAGTSSTPTAQPGPLSHLPAASGHLRQLQGAVSAVLSSLDALSDKLAARPLDAEKLLDELSGTERSLGTGAKVVSAAIASVNAAQVDVVTLDNKLRAAQSTLKEASAALGSWAHHISGLMGQGRSFDDASRSKLCGELGALEGALAAALGGPSGSGGAAAGDPALIECEFGLRSVASSYRELAGLVRDGANLPDGRVRAHMQSTESMAREKEGAVGRLRVSLGKAPVALAGVVKRGMQVADDIVALMDAVEVTGETLGEWADAEADAAAGGRGGGGESVIPTDPFALAGEVLSLRAQLRGAQRVAREAGEAARASASAPASSSDQGAGGSREGSGYVPLEAMQALEAAFETAERQRASDRAALVAQRLRYAGARGTLVDMLDGVRAASLQACVLFGWRAAAAASMVERCQARCDASAAEAERQRGVSRGQAAAAAGVVARLCDDADDAGLLATLRGWRCVTARASSVAHHWAALAMGVLEAAPPPHPLGATVALRCAARAWLAGGPVRPSPPDADKEGGGFDVWLLPGAPELASLALHAWRVYARTTVMSNRAEQLSGAVPLLVARIGDRRREERAWTAWRLWLARRRLLRAEAQVGDHEELLEQRDALQRELSEARGAHEAQMQELREAYARKESAGTRGGGGGGGDAPAGAATGGGATPRTATTASGARTKSPRGTSAGSGGSGSMRAAALVATARGGRGSSGGGAGSARSPPRGSVGSGGRAGALPYPQLSPPQPHLQLCYTHPGGAPGGALPLPFYHSAGGSLPHYTGPAGLTQPHAVVHIPTGLWGGRGGGGSYGGSAGGEHYAATGAPVTHMQARASLPHAHTLMAPAASPPPPLLTYDDSYVGALFHVVPAAHVPPAPHRAGGDRAAPQAEQPQRGGHPLPQPQPWPQPAASGGPSLIRRIEPGGPHAHGAHAAPPAVATRAPLQPATRAATSAGGGWPRAASAGGAAADRKVSSVGGGAAGAAATAAARPESGPKRPAWGAGRGVAAPPPAAGGAGVVAPAEGEPPGGDRTSVSARASAITSAVARLSSDLHAHTRLHAAAAAVSPRVVQEGAGVGVLMVPVSPSRAPAGDSAREQLQVSPPIGAGSPRDHMLLARRTFDATGSDAAAPTALLVPGQQQQQQQQQAPQGYALPGAGASAGGTQHMHEHAGGAEEADEGMPVARTVPPPQPTPAADQTQQQQTQQQQARRAPPPPGSRLHQGTLSSHVKRRDCGLPGGIANLASVPPPAPAAAPPSVPLSTYVAPAHLGRASSSTGAPAAGSAPAGSSSGVAEAVVAPGAAPVAAAAAAAAAMAVARALGEAAGLAVHGQEVPHGRRSVAYPHGVPGPAEPVGLPGSKHASHAYHGGTAGAGAAASGSSSSAAERLGLPPPGGGTRAAVRFELAGGHGQAGAAPPAGSGGAATFVMLPQPARFDISKMTR